nr:redox-sensing transcriptional repressor Rex [uncultured Holophaga sp.]
MAYGYRIGSIPITTVQRLPSYLRVLRLMQRAGRDVVSSNRLAELLQLEAIQVRKDFGFIGMVGMPKTGFQVEELVRGIEHCLNWNRITEAVLVGAGHLGSALLGYEGFHAHGLNICAAFDRDPGLLGRTVKGMVVRSLEDLDRVVEETGARMGILTVSPQAAQEVADQLVKAGVQGIWNFTGQVLTVPAGVIVQDQDIAIGLAVLSAKLSVQGEEEGVAGEP